MLAKTRNIFIVGIKGIAMANLALILKKMGKSVCGSDVNESFITDDLLAKNAIKYSYGFSPIDLPNNTDLVVCAASHGGVNNPQVIEAKRKGIDIIIQPALIESITSLFRNKIAVCGAHGKTTTSSLLSYLFIQLQQYPSYLVGAPRFNNYWGADYRQSDYFVLEADEYGVNPPFDLTPKFHYLNPDYIIATNIDFDHPDIYQDLSSVKKAFLKFFQKSSVKKIIACHDDKNLQDVLKDIPKSRIITYGFSDDADLHLHSLDIKIQDRKSWQEFTASYDGQDLGEFKLLLFGRHNVLNAGGVILFAWQQGFNLDEVKKALSAFTGASRRFELIAQTDNNYLIDDYAHHPAEIQATISALKTRFPKRRIVVIFQPHTFSRTQALKSELVIALSQADLAIIADIFASSREKSDAFVIKSSDLEKEAHKKGFHNLIYKDTDRLSQFLKTVIKKGDVVCTMGAGDIYRLKNDIIRILNTVR